MTTYTIHPDSVEYLNAAKYILEKYKISIMISDWWDIAIDYAIREEFQRLWWIEFASIINVPDYHYYYDDPVKIQWSTDHERELVAFILRWS